MLTIGLTGGIGSGKTTVSDLFQSLGVPIVDADIVAREVVEPGEPGLEQITQQFGKEILNLDGTLNRQQLRKLVFNDTKARHKIEQILHPLIRQRSQAHLASLNAPYAIHAIPLIVETGQTDLVDLLLVVDCPEKIQIERICKRDRVDPEQARAILSSQCSRSQRLSAADDVIDNNQPIENLKQVVETLHAKYLALSKNS